MPVNIENISEVLSFGKREQNKLSRLSSDILSSSKANGLSNMDNIINDLLTVFDGTSKSKRFSLFRKNSIQNVESQVMDLTSKLEVSYINLLNNVHDMQNLFNGIALINEEIKAKISEGDQFVSTHSDKNKENIERFKSVLHSLEISTVIASQMMAQVQTIITADKVLVRKIKFTIQNTIPIWRNSNISASDPDPVIEELKAALSECQKNIKEYEKFQLISQVKER